MFTARGVGAELDPDTLMAAAQRRAFGALIRGERCTHMLAADEDQ